MLFLGRKPTRPARLNITMFFDMHPTYEAGCSNSHSRS